MVKVRRLILQHLQQIIKPYLHTDTRIPPLDRHVSDYFREHKSLGSSERRQLYNLTYDLVRYHVLLNHLCKGSLDLDMRVQMLHNSDFYKEIENPKLSKWIRCSFPKLLYDKIEKSVPSDFEAFQLCKAMNTRAPLTVRINPDKTSRSDFIRKIGNFLKIELKKTEISPYGVIIPANKNIDLYQTQQFKNGEFEVQDQASQLAALQVKCKPGDIVLDYCSGSGGKSLAISHFLQGKGQIFLHDPRPKTLQNAKKRFQRADITNVQYHNNQDVLQRTLLNKADWIILDVPCSGTGTIRRNPDIKLRFNEEILKHHTIQQQQIFTKAMKYMKKNGRIAYMTCSLLEQENENQIKKFIKTFDLEVVDNEILRTKTVKGGMDSMFAAVLKRKQQ